MNLNLLDLEVHQSAIVTRTEPGKWVLRLVNGEPEPEPTPDPAPEPDPAPVPPPVRDTDPRVNPDFTPEALTDEQQVWYARYLEAMPHIEPNPMNGARAGDGYRLRFTGNNWVNATVNALRVTGDRGLLEALLEFANVMRANNTIERGMYPAWPHLRKEDVGTPNYGQSGSQSDSLLFGLVGQLAYVFHVNSDIDREVEHAADLWRESALMFYEKWRTNPDKQGMAPAYRILDDMAHCVAQAARGYWYLWRVTGVDTYKACFDDLWARIGNHLHEVDGALDWDHILPLPNQSTPARGSQPTGYASTTLAAIADLLLAGVLPGRNWPKFTPFNLARNVERMLAAGPEFVASRINGTGQERGMENMSRSFPVWAHWDGTGAIAASSEAFWAQYSYKPQYAAFALWALAGAS